MNVIKVAGLIWSARKPLGWLISQVRRRRKATAAVTLAGIILAIIQGDFKMESLLSPEVISLVATGLIAIFGAVFGSKLLRFKKLALEAVDLIKALVDSLADGKLSPDEIKRVQKELSDVINELKGTDK